MTSFFDHPTYLSILCSLDIIDPEFKLRAKGIMLGHQFSQLTFQVDLLLRQDTRMGCHILIFLQLDS